MKRFLVCAAAVVMSVNVSPLLAQNCGTIFWASQGDREHYYNHGEEVVYRAGGGGVLRVYFRSRSQAPYTLVTDIGHPWDFNLKGTKPAEMRNILRIKPQNAQQRSNGKVNLAIGQPGVTWVGYEIVGAYRQGVFESIPPRCRCQTVQVRVVPRGGAGGGGVRYNGDAPADPASRRSGGFSLLDSPLRALHSWLSR